jgi:hypothetical protein
LAVGAGCVEPEGCTGEAYLTEIKIDVISDVEGTEIIPYSGELTINGETTSFVCNPALEESVCDPAGDLHVYYGHQPNELTSKVMHPDKVMISITTQSGLSGGGMFRPGYTQLWPNDRCKDHYKNGFFEVALN